MSRVTPATTMQPEIEVQYACGERDYLPTEQQFQRWVHAAIDDLPESMAMTLRLVDNDEAAELNQTWRNKPGPTNVLSFPYRDKNLAHNPMLGDLVLCVPLVQTEAVQQNKPLEAHWAHLVVHGSLHLLGYDHINTEDAIEMESLETAIMASLGYDDPYQAN